jgi:hypothetical protein
MFETTLPEDQWTRDAALMIGGWLLGTVLGIVLLLTVITWAFT